MGLDVLVGARLLSHNTCIKNVSQAPLRGSIQLSLAILAL